MVPVVAGSIPVVRPRLTSVRWKGKPVSDEPENQVLVYLRRIDKRVGELGQDMIEVKERLGCLEQQYSSISRRLDRVGGDVELIKRRLDLVEPAH